MLGKLSIEEIETVLSENIVGRIGCHADGVTYVVPVSYAYDGQYIYVRTQEGMKIDMLRKSPELCFQVDEMKNMANWKSVITWGVFEELNEPELRNAALQKLINRIIPTIASKTVKFYDEWPFYPDNLENIQGIVFRALLKRKTGRFEDTEGVLSNPDIQG